MKPEEIISIVEELNSDLYDICPELCESGVGYTYTTSGYFDAVDFCNQSLYCSERDGEDDVEDAGGFKEFLIQERDRFIDELVKVKEGKIC